MKVITYRVTLLEPTLVTALDGDPNSAATFGFLPGSVLRGAIIHKYSRAKNIAQQDLLNDRNASRLFFDGMTLYLNGYPLFEGQRALPAPVSWQKKKSEDTPPYTIYDFAIKDASADPNLKPTEKPQWKGVGETFCVMEGRVVKFARAETQLAVHTARNRRFGRPQEARRVQLQAGEDRGAIYRYEALAKGQTFEAAILCDQDDDANLLKDLLQGEVSLGGSRSGGYGRAQFHDPQKIDEWHESASQSHASLLIVTLLSDALVHDSNGQFVVDADAVQKSIEARLGGLSLKRLNAFMRARAVGGFNRKWGLPLPQTLAIGMGSVFVFDNPKCTDEQLRALVEQGIGERRAEGFGRIAVNWHTLAELQVPEKEEKQVAKQKPEDAPPAVEINDKTSSDLAKRMAERLLRRALDDQIMARANQLAKISRAPHKAQLSRLRNIIHDELLTNADPKRVENFLADVNARNTARKQFEQARLEWKEVDEGKTRHEGLTAWLANASRVRNEKNWLELLGLKKSIERAVGTVKIQPDDQLRAEYVLRLIDAVLARAIKLQGGE